MGNQKDNKLPQCQLERLQDMMNSLYSEQQSDPHEERLGGSQQPMEKGETREKPVGFWMDTLCIPVPESPELDSSWAEGLRKDAIAKMRYVYEAADKVLVIDSWIQELSRSASIIDKAARIFLSNWQHRLWTLQEGVLARHLFFQFADGTESLEQLWYQQGIESKICPGLYSSIVHCTLPLIPMAKPQLKERAEEKNLAAKMLPILEVVTHRKTSKLTDETICIATLLNFEEKSIRKILDFKSPEERMRAFLVILGEFHQNIIFCEFPMLQTPGFRWAPRSFLNQTGSLWPKSANELSQDQPGDRFSVLASSGGLHVTFPGIKLGAVNRITEKLMCVVPYHDEQTIYGVLLTENLTKLTNWSPDNHYGIISSAPIHGSCGDIACLFGCLKDKGQEGIIEIQRLCNARLKPLRNFKSERGADTTMHLGKYGKRFYGDAEDYAVWLRVWGEFLEEDQKWCVV